MSAGIDNWGKILSFSQFFFNFFSSEAHTEQTMTKPTPSPRKSLVSTIQNKNVSKLPLNPIGMAPGGVFQQVAIGIACASYWRGMWYLLDDNLFPNNPFYSATTCLGLGTGGLAFTQGYIAKKAKKDLVRQRKNLPRHYSSIARFGTLYCVSTSCVLVWRGTWMLWDIAYEQFHKDNVKATDPNHLTKSGILSHGCAVGGLLIFGYFASVLAPPARVSVLKDCALKAKTWQEYSKAAKWFFK